MSSESVAQAFKGHQEEIKRRSEAATVTSDRKGFEKSTKSMQDFPLRIESQNFVLFSVSHVEMCPFSENAKDPAVRFYGCFPTQEEAMDHVPILQQSDPSCNLQITRVDEWTVMAKSAGRTSDQEWKEEHIKTILGMEEEERKEKKEEFDTNVKKKQGGVCDVKKEKEKEKKEPLEGGGKKEGEGEERKPLKKATKLSRMAEVRDQNVVVVCFLPDRVQAIPEPLFRVLAVFSTQEEADHYVRNTAGNEPSLEPFTMDCCCLYEWLRPQSVDVSSITEVFRQGELNSIIQNHKKQPKEVEAFKKWRETAEPPPSSDEAAVEEVAEEVVEEVEEAEKVVEKAEKVEAEKVVEEEVEEVEAEKVEKDECGTQEGSSQERA